MSFELINLRSGRVLPFDSMRIALEKAERKRMTDYSLWEVDLQGRRSLRLQVGSSSS